MARRESRSRHGLRSVGAILFAAAVFASFAAAGLFHTWLRVEGLRESYRLSEATAHHRKLLRDNERLRLEVATLTAPTRIERLARKQLGMAPPRPQQVVVLPEPEAEPERAPVQTASSPSRRGVLATAVEVFGG